MAEQQKRQVALKLSITDLANGEFIVNDGSEPNCVRTKGNVSVSRANIIAMVVSKIGDDGNYGGIVLDDGSGSISARSFEKGVFEEFSVGDLVQLVGRPRAYGNEIYIAPEIIRKVENKRWAEVRKLELKNNVLDGVGLKKELMRPEEKKEINESREVGLDESSFEKIIAIVREFDKGDGADVGSVLKKINQPDAEKAITALLKQGEVFEIRPGKIKVLE